MEEWNGSVWFGLCDTRWRDSLLFHPVGLRTQDETEKILIWNSWSCICRRWSSTPLIIQPGALKHQVLLQLVLLADAYQEQFRVWHTNHVCQLKKSSYEISSVCFTFCMSI